MAKMNWKFDGDLIIFTIESNTIVKRWKSREDGVIHFQGGTLIKRDDGWYGGVDIAYRRYFIRDNGVLLTKPYLPTALSPYTFRIEDDLLFARLWEPIEYQLPVGKVHQINKVYYFFNPKTLRIKALTNAKGKSFKK